MRIHELDESLKKSRGIAEAGPFSYGAKKPKKGSLAHEIQQKHKQQDKNYKPIEPKDQMVGVAKLGEAQKYTRDQIISAIEEFDKLYQKGSFGMDYEWTNDDLARLTQLIKITGRNQRSWLRDAKLGDMLDFVTRKLRTNAAKSGKLAAFTGQAPTARDLAHQITFHTNGTYEYRTPRTWTNGYGQKSRDPSEFVEYANKAAFDDAMEWIQSKGKAIHFKDHSASKSVRTGYKIGNYLISPSISTIGPFSNNPRTSYAISVRSAKALTSGTRVVQDITDQQAAAISDIAATKSENSMASIAAMLNILKGRDELQGIMDRSKVDVLKNIVDQSKKINMQDKAKLDSIINSAGQFKESKVTIDELENELEEATYSAGGGIGLDFKAKDTVRHSLLGDVLVVGFDGSSAIVKNSKGKMFKVSPAGLMLVKKASTLAQPALTQTAPAVPTASQKSAPIGQSITYNTSKGPAKFTKTSKGWEALVGTAKRLFTTGDNFYTTLEKVWQSQK